MNRDIRAVGVYTFHVNGSSNKRQGIRVNQLTHSVYIAEHIMKTCTSNFMGDMSRINRIPSFFRMIGHVFAQHWLPRAISEPK